MTLIYSVVDASHYQDFTSYTALAAGGITAVILKATQGTGFVDPLFAYRVPRMIDAGLQVGAYHFMSGSGNGAAQADFFLQTVSAFPQVKLCAMDLEPNPGAQSTVADGEAFVTEFNRNMNYFPLCYMEIYGPLENGSGLPSAVLSQCPLWLPKYGPAPTHASLPAGFSNFVLWQCNDGAEGSDLGPVQGVSGPIDQDAFNGTAAQLQTLFQQGHF
jgi:lysozyme